MLLVVGSPGGRRNSLDGLVVQTVPAAAATMATYARALTQRNNLLRAIREGTAAPEELHYWDAVVIDDGAQIVDWRREALARLAEPLSDAHQEIAPGEEPLLLRYLTNAEPAETETTRDALRRRLTETREKEMWNGATLIGPHRDDVIFVSDDRELSTFASRGQQRTAILAYKLAQLDLLTASAGKPPAAAPRRCLLGARSRPSRAPRAPHRCAAPGVRDDHDDRRSGSGSRRCIDRLGSHTRPSDARQQRQGPVMTRRPMRRVGDMLPKIAADIGIESELRMARQMTAWERLVEEHLPAARGTSKLLAVQPPALVVSAVGQRRRAGAATSPIGAARRIRANARWRSPARAARRGPSCRARLRPALDCPRMASRLALKYGLVSEEDRLSNSSDAIVVTEPTTGSKTRTKGSLYLIVSSKTIGGRDARRVPARRRHDPSRVLLRRVGGHCDRPREVRPCRQSSPAPVARGRQPGRVLDRHCPGRRARQRAVCRDCR